MRQGPNGAGIALFNKAPPGVGLKSLSPHPTLSLHLCLHWLALAERDSLASLPGSEVRAHLTPLPPPTASVHPLPESPYPPRPFSSTASCPLGSSNQQSQNGVFERTPLHACHVISPPICFSQRLWKLKQDEGWLCGGVCLACMRLQAKLSSTSNENKSTPKPEVACVTTLRFFLAEVLCSPAWCCLSVCLSGARMRPWPLSACVTFLLPPHYRWGQHSRARSPGVKAEVVLEPGSLCT